MHGKLVRILDTIFQQNKSYSGCTRPISVVCIVAARLHVLSGSRTKEQWHTGMYLHYAAYKAVDAFINTVNLTPELEIQVPRATINRALRDY
jgi:hypothetical protein